MDRMNKLNRFQDILHLYMHSLSSVLAAFLRSALAVSCLVFSFFVFMFLLSSSVDNHSVIKIDPILNSGLLLSLVFISLLLVSYLSVMTNNNPARQKLAVFLFRADAPNEHSRCAEAQSANRCRAPFFRFR